MCPAVAPLAGSVDRNRRQGLTLSLRPASLPSRGAWIEMLLVSETCNMSWVAPLAGSVDRNKSREA